MKEEPDRRIAEQLDLIERLILEGRRSMEYWGWVFVMWGVAHVAALVWSALWTSNPGMPWAILMGGCGVAMAVGSVRAGMRGGKSTVMGRAQGASWAAFTISVTILWVAGAVTRTFDLENLAVFYAIFFTLIGGAHFTSGITVRLPVQTAVGVLWWGAALVTMAIPGAARWSLMVMAFVGEIAFGLYLMALERKGGRAPVPAT
jgi:hypothetical protein